MTLVRVRAATRRFGRRAAIDDCSLAVGQGEVVGVIGPNGAGKTTLLRIIGGELAATSGRVDVAGFPSGSRPARRQVGFAPDPPAAPGELTGAEWLHYLASHRASTAAERRRLVAESAEFAMVAAFADRRIAGYSRGMGQRLALAGARVCAGSVMVLDEVLSGVDPLIQRELRHRLAGWSAGRAVIISSHDLGAVERLATRVIVLVRGRVAADLPTAALARQRIAELDFAGAALPVAERVLRRYPGATRTGRGMAIPLAEGLTVDALLDACRELRLAVAACRVRYRVLEDVLVAAAGAGGP